MKFQPCYFEFSVTAADMEKFLELSGDDSLIHSSPDFAVGHGFEGVVVYGGILLAKLSRCLGRQLPGPRGISLGWSIRYHAPLYVGETALFEAVPGDYSESTRFLAVTFTISREGKKLASGKAESILLDEPAPDSAG
jgi:3-hydroxybutyryl-CoA dehydratase